MTEHKYILDAQGNPKPCRDVVKWGRSMERAHVVGRTYIGKDCRVSTVFLGLDHNYEEDGPPILWETMVFGGKLSRAMMRCAGSREQAEAMHNAMVRKVVEAGE